MIGRRLGGGPFGFQGFCSALSNPCAISFGWSPVVAIVFVDIGYFRE